MKAKNLGLIGLVALNFLGCGQRGPPNISYYTNDTILMIPMLKLMTYVI